ncbi:MAG: hypothetical protein KC978_00405 [Candidatus Omnitrophica bacterium]|nr:hypothetical protein [Candidatus Omnitrophota bacterium]
MTPTSFKKTTRNATLTLFGTLFLMVSASQTAQANCPCNQRMEAKLKSEYTYYADNYSVLEFKFQVHKQAQFVDVTLVGQNFGLWDTEWISRDQKFFLSYLGAIGKDVSAQMDRPVVKFRVIDLQNNEIGKFQYGK